MEVNKITNCSFLCFSYGIDEEEKRIIRRLLAYGVKPTFRKSADKAKLHEIELREAKKINYISNKFLTVTQAEQEKIQEKKKEKRNENNPKMHPESREGAKILGKQIYQAIQMKNKNSPKG